MDEKQEAFDQYVAAQCQELADALSAAQATLQQKETVAAQKQTQLTKAEQTAAAKNSAYEAASQALETATTAYDAAVADADQKADVLWDATNAYFEAKSAYDTAQEQADASAEALRTSRSELQTATAAANAALAAYNEAKQKQTEAQSTADDAAALLAEKTADVLATQKDLNKRIAQAAEAHTAYDEAVQAHAEAQAALDQAVDDLIATRNQYQPVYDSFHGLEIARLYTSNARKNAQNADEACANAYNALQTATANLTAAQKNKETMESLVEGAMQKVDTAAINLAIAEAEAEQYLELTEGSKSKWTNGGSGLLTVGANGSKDLFKSLIIDGKSVDPAGYDILTGDMSEETQQALQLAINDSVLNQLAAGNHTFMLRYTYGDTLTGSLSIKPGAPVVTATNAATGLNLSWKKIPGEITYVIQRSIGNGNFKTIATTKGTTYNDKKANSNGVKYNYRIQAVQSAQNRSDRSKVATMYRVARPTITNVTNQTGRQVTMRWTGINKASGYLIHYAPNKTLANKKVVTIGKKTTTSTTLRNLVKNKTYYLRMRTFLTVAGKRYYSAWGLIKSVLVKK